ncbi:MFS transporter [Methylocystis sp. 9N]|uniref:MFS transporter n=1 Tax=Methylocystis borbori TaxID=3118750 RepID=A0ABU7XEK8_9HYPH
MRSFAIGSIGFLTLVDLFAAQAILPQLMELYRVGPAKIGLAINASTLGMAVAGPIAAVAVRGLSRRSGIWISLALLAAPTALLAIAPTLLSFTLLRVLQGVFMASAFTLTLTHFAERCSKHDMPRALAAYVTGSVLANLLGRLIASNVAQEFGASAAFLTLAALNLSGALLAFVTLTHVAPLPLRVEAFELLGVFARHLRNPALRRAYAVGFLILFGFVGLFSYVGFALVAPAGGLSMRVAGLAFLCFAPSLATTPMAGRLSARLGTATAAAFALLCAVIGAFLSIVANVSIILLGMALFSSGAFIAQAVVTSFVGRVAKIERAAASGLYLSAYYSGGLAGAAAIGALYEKFGWSGAASGVAIVLALASLLAAGLVEDASA